MSKGSTIVPVRIPDAMLQAIGKAIASRNRNTAEEPWTRTDFIRVAIREKLAHRLRSNRPRKRNVPTPTVPN